MTVALTNRRGILRLEEYRSRWGARASNPLEILLNQALGWKTSALLASADQ